MKKSKLLALSLIGLSAISLASCGPKTGPVDPTKYTYELTIEPNKSFLKSEKRSVKKLANGNVREIIDYEFIVPEKEVAEVTNYNDLLIGANPLLLTPIAIEMNEDTVVRTLTAEETKSEFNPITEFSKSGYGDANIDSSLYNTEQLRTCYSISQSESGTLQSKYYNVSIVIEDNEAPVLNQAGVAELPFTLDIDSIKSSLKNSIHSYLTDNNSATAITVTLKDDPILTGLTNLNKEQVIHFDATDSDGNKIENQEFKYKLVDNLNYFETIDQETVNTVSYKNAQADYIAQNYELYKGIYSYKILNEDELVFSNENADNIEEIKTVINKEQTIKYGIYEDNQLIGEFNYKFKMIDDVAPYMVWADDGSVITVDRLNNLTAEHDNDLNARFQKAEILTPQALYDEFQSVAYAKDEICQNSKIIMTIYHVPNGSIGANFKAFDGSLYSKVVILEYIPFTNPKYDVCAKNYVIGEYDENGLIK